ncbi:MAG: cytochrome c oxidase assembly protein subunit 15 [Puniceicoccaceae bacterium 5H]|nr:MAG: cytochrome c oxidase assembly protein subunit 15 [Puniceicoccaceae bacterium 5H]
MLNAIAIIFGYFTLQSHHQRSTAFQPWLSGYAFLCYAVALILLYAGGFTTTIGAGMVFPDWPLSNGSLNPPGWTVDQAMMAEHGHRLLGSTVGSLCIGLVVWTQLREGRKWVRRLAIFALGFVIFQGLLGGARVLLVNTDLAMVHGITAQVFLCILASMAVACSRWWRNLPTPDSLDADAQAYWRQQRWIGGVLVLLTLTQLTIGSVLRHAGVGMAIPYFPEATADGSLLPASWNWATGINMAHRATALIIFLFVPFWAHRTWRAPGATRAMKGFVMASLVLVFAQVLLGASIIWTGRAPIQTTLHVLNGAIFLSVTWVSVFAYAKPLLSQSECAQNLIAPDKDANTVTTAAWQTPATSSRS